MHTLTKRAGGRGVGVSGEIVILNLLL